jgi:thiosulfate dehydrogenase
VLDSAGGVKIAPLSGDTARGRAIFASICAQCHGANGNGGTFIGPVPPLWGERSFNIGAGMARLRTLAAFVRHNMPFNQPGTLSDQQAFDVAAYVISRPRPDLAGKEKDWPNGDPPPDVAYPTDAAARKATARSTPTGAH